MRKTTVIYPDDVEKIIEDYRAKQRPIPTWTQAVCNLIRKAGESER
jgi:hypothetical protein